MKDKNITITQKGITQKQFTNLVLELNIMRKAWRPYGVDINIQAPGIKKIIAWGTSNYDSKTDN